MSERGHDMIEEDAHRFLHDFLEGRVRGHAAEAYALAAEISSAMSLKRIADALEEIVSKKQH